MSEAVALLNPLTSLDPSDTENLDIADAQANIISTIGQLLAFFGPVAGGAVLGAVSAVIGIAAIVGSNDLRKRIELERYLRGTTTPSTVDITVAQCKDYILARFYFDTALLENPKLCPKINFQKKDFMPKIDKLLWFLCIDFSLDFEFSRQKLSKFNNFQFFFLVSNKITIFGEKI